MIRFKPTDPMIAWRSAHPFEDGWHGVHNPFVCHFGGSQQKSTTATSTSAPWAPQQPYLQTGFTAAGNLLNQPAPQQQNPVAPLNQTQLDALAGISSTAANGTPITGAATGFDTNLENGAFLGSNPSNGFFSSLAGTNIGLNNPGATILSNIGGSNPGASAPGAGTFAQFANGDGAGSGTLKNYANGGYFSGNNYTDPTAQSILAKVIPQVASAFNRGNAINNPLAARSAAEGATAALAPLEFQNFQTQEQLQQQAATTLGANALTGASGANAGYFTGLGDQLAAGQSLNSGAIAGGNLQATAASGLSSGWQQVLNNMVQGASISPNIQSLNYGDLSQLFGAGQVQQTQAQNEAGGQAATYNYSQMSPYQQLEAYMKAITGGVTGSSGTQTTPYFQNQTADTLGMISGGAGLLSGLGSAAGAIGGAGSIGSGIMAALPFLAAL